MASFSSVAGYSASFLRNNATVSKVNLKVGADSNCFLKKFIISGFIVSKAKLKSFIMFLHLKVSTLPIPL